MNEHILTQSQGNKKPHHRQIVADILLGGQSLTQADFSRITSLASRLAPRILDLKKRGYPIDKRFIDLGDGTHVAQYYLPKSFLADVANYGLDLALTYSQKQNQINKEMERVA